MGLTIQDLISCSPDAIDAVAASWERLSAAMMGDEAVADREVIAPLRDGGWISKDGNRAIELIGYVGDQLEALRVESAAMASIVREAAGELRAAQNELRTIQEDIRTSGMTLGADGAIHWSTTSDGQHAEMQSKAQVFQQRIAATLRRATDADTLAAETMRKNTDSVKNKLDFNVGSLGGDPAADAIRVKDIYAKLQGGKDLTDEEMQQVKLLFQDNKGDAHFQSTLLRQLGPQGMIDVVNKTNAPAHADMGQADLVYIRNSLRETLSGASATLANDEDWMTKLAQAGRTSTPYSGPGVPTTFGYQTLDTLLREGTYDPKFLNRTGADLLAFDKEMGSGRGWNTNDPNRDPVTGLMIAMKNNPAASTQFFTGQPGNERLSYLLDERTQTTMTAGGPPSHVGPLGQALVAATPPQSTPESVGVVANVVNHFGTVPPKDIPGELQKPMGDILANNIESVHVGLTGPGRHNPLLPEGVDTPLAQFNQSALERTLSGMDADQVKRVSVAETAYTVTGFEMIQNKTADPTMTYKTFANDYAQAQGIFAGAVGEHIQMEAEDKVSSTTTKGEYISSAIGAVVTTVPGVGDPMERGVNAASVRIVEDMNKTTTDQASADMAKVYDTNISATYNTAKAWLENNTDLTDGQIHEATTDMQPQFNSSYDTVERTQGR